MLGKIIAGAPVSATQIRKSVPTNVDAAIRKALEKLPADRFTGAQEFAKALGDPGFRHADEAVAGVAGGPGLWNPLQITTTAVALVLALALGWSLLPTTPEPRPLARFEVTFGENRGIAPSAFGVTFALSPDGSRIVYVGVDPDGGRLLWQRPLDDLEPAPIPGTEGASTPVLSPDGLSVVFTLGFGGPKKTVSLGGGPPFTVVGSSQNPTSAWGSDGMIYFTLEDVIYRVPATGGEPETVTTSPRSDRDHKFPDVLPDGRGLLLTVYGGSAAESRIAVVGPEGGDVREILTGAMARYAASGHIVYSTVERTLMAAPFDLDRLEVTGPAVPLLEGVEVRGVSASQFA